MNRYASRVLILLLVLACFWLALSGYFKPLLLGLGAASCLLVAWITLRKSLIDKQSVLARIRWGQWFRYNIWLVGQIAKSTIDVASRIVDPRLPISPTVQKVPAKLSDLGKVIYANSITLTPGTVSINIVGDEIVVHSLTEDGMAELQKGEMCRRVAALEKPHVKKTDEAG